MEELPEEPREEPAGGSDSAEDRGSDVGPLGQEILDLFGAVYRLEARLSERIAAFDASREWEVDGSASAQAWLRYHGRLSPSAASGAVKTARRLRHLPRTQEAFAAGEISSDHVRVIATGTDVAESLDGIDELDVGRSHTTGRRGREGLRRCCSRPGPGAVASCGDALASCCRTWGGRQRRSSGRVPSQAAHVTDPRGTVHPRWRVGSRGRRSRQDRPRRAHESRPGRASVPSRRWGSGEGSSNCDRRPGLGSRALCRSSASLLGSALRCGSRPRAQLIASRRPPRRFPQHAGSASPNPSTSQALDVGRHTPTIPPAIRRALVGRDRGCAWPGCDRPPGWCDAHHSCTGPTAARHRSTTPCSSAEHITPNSTNTTGRRNSPPKENSKSSRRRSRES